MTNMKDMEFKEGQLDKNMKEIEKEGKNKDKEL